MVLERRRRQRLRKGSAILAGACLLISVGCARPQPTQEQVTGKNAPPDLQLGPPTPGGPSNAPTGAGAGGSAAAGYQIGRVGGPSAAPMTPAYPPGRMAPNGTSGSGLGDRGNPISPDTPMVSR